MSQMQVIEGSSQSDSGELIDWSGLNRFDFENCLDKRGFRYHGNIFEDMFHLLIEMLIDYEGEDHG
jgi:hypothetical protein